MHWVRMFTCIPVPPGSAFLQESAVTTAHRPQAWRTIPEILLRCAAHRPGVIVLDDGTTPGLTADGLLDLTRRGAGRLVAAGVGRSAFVVVDSTSLSWSQAASSYLAITWLGAGAVLTMGAATLQAARERIGPVLAVTAGGAAEGIDTIDVRELVAGPPLTGDPPARPDDDLDV